LVKGGVNTVGIRSEGDKGKKKKSLMEGREVWIISTVGPKRKDRGRLKGMNKEG